MSELIRLNGFVQADNGVYHAPNVAHEFAYTDGEHTERNLDKILRASTDLSSDSSELHTHIKDWPSEYHLSATRSNLLRALNLQGVKRVLELGCGCGAITRYLSEQTHIQVDAVEGSPVRANLAALRCRGQENVTISVSNFNDINLPDNHYDLVLYVGVTEYAGRFSNRDSDQAALHDLLALAKRSCKKTGITLVAIENRLGLKYMLGANEDHYAKPFIGINDYPRSSGIRTYSKLEWQTHIRQAKFKSHQFLYPFPDYKVPTLIVAEAACKTSADSRDLYRQFKTIKSRDYNANFNIDDEAQIWQSLHQASTFAQHANSFLILMGDAPDAIQFMCKPDFKDWQFKCYPMPNFSYLETADKPTTNTQSTEQTQLSNNAEFNRLTAKLNDLENEIAVKSNELALIKNSLGQRLLNIIRRLLGKPTV